MPRKGLGAALALLIACSPPPGSGESGTSTGGATTGEASTGEASTGEASTGDVVIHCPWDVLVTGPGQDMPTNGLHSQADVDTFVGCTDVRSNLAIHSSSPLDLTRSQACAVLLAPSRSTAATVTPVRTTVRHRSSASSRFEKSAASISLVSASPTSPR